MPERFHSLLYIVQEKLGDGFLTLPFLYELHRKFPHVEISVIASKYNRILFEPLDFIHELFIYRKDHRKLFRQLKSRNYDIFFNPKDHPSVTILRMMKHINARYKVGLQHHRHNKHFDVLLPNDDNRHIVEKNALLLENYAVNFPINPPITVINQFESDFFKKFPRINLKDNICVNLSSGGIRRKLPVEKWIAIIDFILKHQLSDKINLLAMPENQADATKIKNIFFDKIVYPIPTKNIYEAGIVINHSRALLSPDTALIHVAAAVQTPVIGLYQNKGLNLKRFSPYQATCEIVLSPDKELENIAVEDICRALIKLKNENILH